MVLENLEPKLVWEIFENVLASTPRESKKEEKIRKKIKSWVEKKSNSTDIIVSVTEDDEIMLISDRGTLVRTRVSEVRVMGRNTQGVRLIRLIKGENLVGLQRVDEMESDEDEEELMSENSDENTSSSDDVTSVESTDEASDDNSDDNTDKTDEGSTED